MLAASRMQRFSFVDASMTVSVFARFLWTQSFHVCCVSGSLLGISLAPAFQNCLFSRQRRIAQSLGRPQIGQRFFEEKATGDEYCKQRQVVECTLSLPYFLGEQSHRSDEASHCGGRRLRLVHWLWLVFFRVVVLYASLSVKGMYIHGFFVPWGTRQRCPYELREADTQRYPSLLLKKLFTRRLPAGT